jgi:hypothetical protein
MDSRSIQIGDIVQITVNEQHYNLTIDGIDSQGIHAQQYTIIPIGNDWQVQNYPIYHTITFLPGIDVTPETPYERPPPKGRSKQTCRRGGKSSRTCRK